MDEYRRSVIALIRSGICGESYCLPETFDVTSVLVLGRKHNILPILYYGAVNCGVDKSSAAMQELFGQVVTFLRADMKQSAEIDAICSAFDQAQITYMPMKGMVIKKLYPHSEMRGMGDADILIKMDEYVRIAEIMTDLGFQFVQETDHELVWRKGITHTLQKRSDPAVRYSLPALAPPPVYPAYRE